MQEYVISDNENNVTTSYKKVEDKYSERNRRSQSKGYGMDDFVEVNKSISLLNDSADPPPKL